MKEQHCVRTSNTLKIIHVTSAHKRTSQRILYKECSTLVADGHDVTLIVADGKPEETIRGVNIRSIPIVNGPFSRIRRMYGMARALQTEQADIYHFHDPELLPVALKMARRSNIVYDSHENFPIVLQNRRYQIPKILRGIAACIIDWLERQMGKYAVLCIGATDEIGERFEKFSHSTTVVHNYPQIEEFPETLPFWSQRERAVAFVGGISEARRIEKLLDAIEPLNVRLYLAGSCPDSEYMKRLTMHPAWPKVSYQGVLDREKTVNLLLSVQVGVELSLETQERLNSLPVKIFEYMASGLPVIVTKLPLAASIVEREDAGLQINGSSIENIRAALKSLLDYPEKAESYGMNGRKAVLHQYNWSTEAATLLNAYQMALK